jgi:hypothetical protein
MRSKITAKALAGAAVVLVIAVSGTARAGQVRFLPQPLALPDLILQSYTGNVTNFDRPVVVNGQVIGNIRFDYNTYLAAVPNPFTFVGGAALAGGFFANPGVTVSGNCEIGWIQTVTATQSGENIWDAPGGTTFPDTLTGANPDYSLTRLPDGRVLPQPSVGFQDFPFRTFDQDQGFLAELGLVCKCTEPNPDPNGPPLMMAHILGTFLWGFSVDAADATITPTSPMAWGPPTATYTNTLRMYFDGNTRWHDLNNPNQRFTSTMWSFDTDVSGCFTIAPEPSTFVLFALGLAVLAGYERKRISKKGAAQDGYS